MTAKKIALFIDADNISAKFGKQIFDALEKRGEIFIRRIYGNWEKFSLHGWNDCILNFSLRPVQQTDFATGKNATDMSLTIDAMDVLHDGKAEVFALVSNDSDFTPLAIRLREGGMNVIGLGSAQVSNSFRAACSEFIDLAAQAEVQPVQSTPAVVKKIPPAQMKSPVQISLFDEDKVVELKSSPAPLTLEIAPAPVAASPKVIPIDDRKSQSERDKKIQQLHDILHEAAKTYGDDAGFSPLNHAGQAIRRKNLGYGVKDFGYHQLRDFVADFPDMYETAQVGKNFCYRCRTNDAANPDDGKLKQLHKILREAATVHADKNGFADLGYAGNALVKKNLSIKGSGHSTLQKFVAAFPRLYEMRKTGTIIRYRCR